LRPFFSKLLIKRPAQLDAHDHEPDGQGIAGRTATMKAEQRRGIFQDPKGRFDLRKNVVM